MTGGDQAGRGSPGEVIGFGSDDESPGPLQRLPRWSRLPAAAALAVAVAVWLGPDLLSEPDGAASPQPDRSRSTASTRPAAPLAAADWPVRGDLAGDAGFLAAVLRRVRTDHGDADRVLFAGRLPGGARVAFVGRDRDEASGVRALDVYALRIPPGASVEDGEVSVVGRGLIESTGLLGWAEQGSDGTVQVVLLGRPGMLAAQVSARIDNHPDGSGSRQWLDVRGRDGSLVVDVGAKTDPDVFARTRDPAVVPWRTG